MIKQEIHVESTSNVDFKKNKYYWKMKKYTIQKQEIHDTGWQKLCEGTKGLCQKVWSQTKILSPKIRYFVAIVRFVAIYTILKTLGKKLLFSTAGALVVVTV